MSGLRQLEYGDPSKGVMDEDINDIIDYIIANYHYGEDTNSQDFDRLLMEYGYMIVPIEDPTNLRFGVED